METVAKVASYCTWMGSHSATCQLLDTNRTDQRHYMVPGVEELHSENLFDYRSTGWLWVIGSLEAQ